MPMASLGPEGVLRSLRRAVVQLRVCHLVGAETLQGPHQAAIDADALLRDVCSIPFLVSRAVLPAPGGARRMLAVRAGSGSAYVL